jgi:hypothetical protein
MTNFKKGKCFENAIQVYFESVKLFLEKAFHVDIGHKKIKHKHRFDLGSKNPNILVECKAHQWTVNKNTPSAKISVWNEAMYYFDLAPTGYRKWFIVLHCQREQEGESLLGYYKRNNAHLIPPDVELFEFNLLSGKFIGDHPKWKGQRVQGIKY